MKAERKFTKYCEKNTSKVNIKATFPEFTTEKLTFSPQFQTIGGGNHNWTDFKPRNVINISKSQYFKL